MAHLTTYMLVFVKRDSLWDETGNGNPAGVSEWVPGTSVKVNVTVPDNKDGTLDEFAAEEAGRHKLAGRGHAEEDYSLEEVEILSRYEDTSC